MDSQIGMFDIIENEGYVEKIQHMLDELVAEKRLPSGSLILQEQVENINEGEYLILILEPPYPLPAGACPESFTQTSAMVIKECHSKKDQGKIDIFFRKSYLDMISVPETCELLIPDKSETVRARFLQTAAELIDVIKEVISIKLKYYQSSSCFSCCSRFIECSNAKTCVHENLLYSTGCTYRHHLDNGEIFYGENRNVE